MTTIEQAETTAIDLYDLLKRYMNHIADCEGITFVDRLNDEAVSDAHFSEAEVELLRKINTQLDV